MNLEKNFAHFFKPDVRVSGRDLFARRLVQISIHGDVRIESFIRAASGVRVKFETDRIESPSFTATCDCPPFSKGQFCQHIWATLLELEAKESDFLSSKVDLERFEGKVATRAKPQVSEERKSKLKEKSAEYRKAQYEKKKAWAKTRAEVEAPKKSSAQNLINGVFPEEVESALQYFRRNGFSLSLPVSMEELNAAKRTLSRVFHPDRGGTHAEMLELNQNSDLLADFSRPDSRLR